MKKNQRTLLMLHLFFIYGMFLSLMYDLAIMAIVFLVASGVLAIVFVEEEK